MSTLTSIGSGQVFTKNNRRRHWYVDAVLGNDSNDGWHPNAPLATLVALEKRLPDTIARTTFVHVIGAGPYVMPEFRPRVYRDFLFIIGEDTTTLVPSTACAAGSSAVQVVTAGGLGVDTYYGKTLEWLTGSLTGQRRTIQRHTDTTIFPCMGFTGNPAVGDTFRIFEPAASLTITESMRLTSGPDQSCAQVGDGQTEKFAPCLTMVNLKWVVSAPFLNIELGSTLLLYGIDVSDAVGLVGASYTRLMVGGDFDGDIGGSFRNYAVVPFDYLGVATRLDWSGYGMRWHCVAGPTAFSGLMVGLIASFYGVSMMGRWIAGAGRILVRGGRMSGIYVIGGGSAGFAGVSLEGKTQFADVRIYLDGPCEAHGATADLSILTANLTNAGGTCVLANKEAKVTLEESEILAGDTGFRAMYGGKISFRVLVGISVTGDEVSVGQAPITGDVSVLFASDGDFVAESPSDGSVMQRRDS